VIAVSEGEAAELRCVFPGDAHKVSSIPNVIDRKRVLAAAFAPLEGEARKFTLKHRNSVIVTMVARDDPAKNYPLAAEACRQALAANGVLAIIFVGANQTGPVERMFREFADRVLVIPRLDSVSPLLRASSIVLLTSVKEGGRPLVLQEALALGKPVVATDVPGIQETVRDGKDGILCPAEPGPLASAIMRLATSAEERARLGEEGARGAAESSLEVWAGKYLDVYAAAEHTSVGGARTA
jgi:glycosyltransferase involved in cell wall biosynthesis